MSDVFLIKPLHPLLACIQYIVRHDRGRNPIPMLIMKLDVGIVHWCACSNISQYRHFEVLT